MIISRSVLLRIRNVSDKNCRWNHTKYLCSITFWKSAFYDIRLKNMKSQTVHRWQYNTAYAHCMLDNYGYRHTLRICNTYCFSMSTVVAGKRLNVKLCVHCLSCLHCHSLLASMLPAVNYCSALLRLPAFVLDILTVEMRPMSRCHETSVTNFTLPEFLWVLMAEKKIYFEFLLTL